MRMARSDALVVKASSEGRRTLYIAVGEWRRANNVWHHARRLWLSRTNEAWLLPDPAEPEESRTIFRLIAGRLRAAAEPPAFYNNDPDAGFDRADAYIAAAVEER